ncbi:hypothetical protein ACFLZV_04705, partial [Candidatus Margulisiibacteriota bacterium]
MEIYKKIVAVTKNTDIEFAISFNCLKNLDSKITPIDVDDLVFNAVVELPNSFDKAFENKFKKIQKQHKNSIEFNTFFRELKTKSQNIAKQILIQINKLDKKNKTLRNKALKFVIYWAKVQFELWLEKQEISKTQQKYQKLFELDDNYTVHFGQKYCDYFTACFSNIKTKQNNILALIIKEAVFFYKNSKTPKMFQTIKIKDYAGYSDISKKYRSAKEEAGKLKSRICNLKKEAANLIKKRQEEIKKLCEKLNKIDCKFKWLGLEKSYIEKAIQKLNKLNNEKVIISSYQKVVNDIFLYTQFSEKAVNYLNAQIEAAYNIG